MKVICINVSNKKKTSKEKNCYKSLNIKQGNNNFWELTIPLGLINKRVFEYNKGIINRFKGWLFDKKLLANIKCQNKEKYYILPKILEKQYEKGTGLHEIKTYLTGVIEKAGFKLYSYTGNIKSNVCKYIEKELDKQKVSLPQAKILILYENENNIDYDILMELIKKCKTVDIVCKYIKSSKIENEIEKINNTLGTSIIVKNKINKKDLKSIKYNLAICMDQNKNKWEINFFPIIDVSDNDIDQYDKYVVLANKYKLYRRINGEYLTYMSKNYGRLKILSLLCKMENLA